MEDISEMFREMVRNRKYTPWIVRPFSNYVINRFYGFRFENICEVITTIDKINKDHRYFDRLNPFSDKHIAGYCDFITHVEYENGFYKLSDNTGALKGLPYKINEEKVKKVLNNNRIISRFSFGKTLKQKSLFLKEKNNDFRSVNDIVTLVNVEPEENDDDYVGPTPSDIYSLFFGPNKGKEKYISNSS